MNLAPYIPFVFELTTFACLLFLHKTFGNARSELVRARSNYIFIGLILWLTLQMMLSLSHFYSSDTKVFPPKFVLLIFPPLLLIAALFITKSGRRFIDSLPLAQLTFVNIVRLPVEIVLYWLFLNKAVPELMTFSGRNFDILVGISAPIVALLILRNKINKTGLIAWNIAGLALLLNIVIHAILSAPFPFQRLAFEQPNIAVLYFPFSWLPAFIVPAALFTHLVALRQLTRPTQG
jgi:hypothetical protein